VNPSFAQRVIDAFEAIHPLDRVPRAGYLLRGVPEPESVSAHSHFVAVLALLFLEQYPDEYDRYKVLSMALTHDLSEARILDIPMPYADAYLAEAKHRAEEKITDDLFGGLAPQFAGLCREFNEAESKEARLLRGLDKAQMMLKVLCYEAEHRGCLDEFWLNPKNFKDYGIGPVSDLFDAICERANRPRPQ